MARSWARRLTAGAVAGALTVGTMMWATPAQAAGESLGVTLTQTTGTAPFDASAGATDTNGLDQSDTNDVVRTNDTVTYNVGVRFEGGAQTNPTITFTLPRGEELAGLPTWCKSGSSLTPASLPAPTTPVTAVSWTTLPQQAIVCVVAGESTGTSRNYPFPATIRPEVPNNTVLGPVSAAVTSTQVPTPAPTPTVQHTVSSAPRVDVSKRLASASATSGPIGSSWSACAWDRTLSCMLVTYPLTMSVPSGGKGAAPLTSPIRLTDELSPSAFYPAGTTTSAAWTAAGANANSLYAPRWTECGPAQFMLPNDLPNASLTSSPTASTTNSVRNTGSIACSQTAPGSPVNITLTGTDTTAYTVPTTTSKGTALAADLGLIVSAYIRVQIPLKAIQDLGLDAGGTWALNTSNNFTNLDATSVTGQAAVDSDPSNNQRDLNVRAERGGPGGITKAFVGIPGHAGNTPADTFSPNPYFEGLPGSGTWRDGNTVVVKGQTVLSAVTYTRHGIPPNADDSFLNTAEVCDTWDSTKLQLPDSFAFSGPSTTLIQRPSGGNAAWASFWGDGSAITDTTPRNLKIQYGYTATPGSGSKSDCTTSGSMAIAWADRPADVPGAQLVDGTWQGINRVRMSFTDIAPRGTDYFQINLAVALNVVSTDTVGTILPNWASFASLAAITTMTDVVSNASTVRSNSGYNPADTTGGSAGDRLILGKVNARLKKAVQNKAGNWVTSGAAFTAGDIVSYRLSPSLVADVNDGIFSHVYVEDCLPVDQVFVSSSRTDGAAIAPVVVQSGAPAGSDLACPAGRTYLKWDLGENEIGKVIDPVLYKTELLDTAMPTSTTAPIVDYTNTALISSPDDGSSVKARTASAQILVQVPSGIKISKSVDKGLIELNPAGATHPRTFTWTVTFANLNNPTTVSNADVIDVLPANGLAGTSFHGTLGLNSVTVTTGTGAGLKTGAATNVSTLYTSSAPSTLDSDPTDASNAATGSTLWCSAADGTGTVVSGPAGSTAADCPTSLAQVTGLRFVRPGEFKPTDTLRATITQTPANNLADDVYENVTSGNAIGVSQPVGPASRTVSVIGSSLGDTVWKDTNRNGLQDAGEPGVPGFKVSLTGTDVDGNALSATTTTDASGAYLFTNLPSGNYVVTFAPSSLPAGTRFTTQKAGGTDATDSDGDATTGVTGTIALGANTSDLNVDQGIVEPVGTLTWTKNDPAGAALAGSSWTLSGPGGYTKTVADNGALDTDPADGAFTVTGLEWGEYTLTEATPPTGYQLDTTAHAATIDGTHLVVHLGSITDTPVPGVITWTKTDPNAYPIAGSEWTLTGPTFPTGTTIVDNGAGDTDPADGAIKVAGLEWGTYTLTESKAPTGYTAASTTYTAVLDATHVVVDLDKIRNTPIAGEITWRKTDASGSVLTGSEWTLSGPTFQAGATVVDNGALDADPADGAFKVTGLEWGTYTLTEATAPVGYVLDATPHTLVVGAATLSVSAGTITNVASLGTVTWTKTDPKGTALAGSIWTLTGPGGATTITDNAIGDDDPDNGSFKVSGLAWGTYTLTEKTAPAGYQLATGSKTVTVGSSALALSFGAIVNKAIPPIVPQPLVGAPTITTRTSAARVRVGTMLRDRITLRNFTAGGTSQGTVRLYGPYSSRAAATCKPAKLVATRVFTPRNGTQTGPAVKVSIPGYYTWVAATSADAKNESTTHRCGLANETTLVHKTVYGQPIVEAGYAGVEYSFIRNVMRTIATSVGRARLTFKGIGTSAITTPVGISNNKVEIPSNVAALGFVGKSAALGDVIGSSVIVGHVSDQHDRAGAFYRLSKAKRGQIISVKQGGKTYRFKVTKKASYSRKVGAGVPSRFFSTTGKHQLVLISCTGKVKLGGGRFHYTRNQVVVATPIK